MELLVFSRDLLFIGVIEGYSSLVWTRRYNKSGEFELHCPLTKENNELLVKENIICKKDDSEAGFISYRQLDEDIEGKELLVVKGHFITTYLNRRIIWGTKTFTGATEITMRALVDENSINPTDIKRIIQNLKLSAIGNFPESSPYQVSYQNLTDELENLSTTSNLGFRVNFDIPSKQLVFEVYKGLDRSVAQSINSKTIFSKEFDNVQTQNYVDSLNNYRNLVLVGGIGDGIDRIFSTVGDSTGLDRFEMFNDQKGLKYDYNYSLLLNAKGAESLAVNTTIKTFQSTVNTNSNLKYKIDYNLGDIVTCISKKWGIVLASRIIEIGETYEESGLQLNITFGNNIPTIIDKIKAIGNNQVGSSAASAVITLTNIDGGTF